MSRKNYSHLIGCEFERLTVIELIKGKGGRTMARCICACGKETTTQLQYLLNGHTKSCGCYREETRSNNRAVDLTGRKFHRLMVLERRPGAITDTEGVPFVATGRSYISV